MAASSAFLSSLPAFNDDDFYIRYYVGHHGPQGHEFTEFEMYESGKLRYANNGNDKNEPMIRRELFVNPSVVNEVKRLIQSSRITEVDDSRWPEPNETEGKQELECKVGNHHISYTTKQINNAIEIRSSQDPEGLTIFFRLVQDIRELIMTLIDGHFQKRAM